MKPINIYIYLFLLSFLPAIPQTHATVRAWESMSEYDLDVCFDEPIRQELIEEGHRQLAHLMAYNAKNNAEGCPERNVYFFSLLQEDNWIEYINTGGVNGGMLSSELITQLNTELGDLAANTDKVIYVCLVTELPVKVVSYFSLPNTISSIKATYEQLGNEEGTQSAANISSVQREYDGILQAVRAGNYSNITSSPGYTAYKNADPRNTLLLSSAQIVSTLFHQGSGKVASQTAIIRGKVPDGYFKTYETQWEDYVREYQNNGNSLERDIKASIEFVVSEKHDPTKAKDMVTLGGQQDLATLAHSQNNNDYSNINDNTFLYDFAGVYNNDPTVKDSLIEILGGTLIESNSKMKMFITDKDVATANKDLIKNLDLTLPVHQSTMILWMDIQEDGSVVSTIRYSPDLQAIVSAHMNRRTIGRIMAAAMNTVQVSVTQQVKFAAQCIFRASDFVSKMIAEHAMIPNKYFRKDLPEYDPSFKRVFKVIMPAIYYCSSIVDPLMTHYNIQLDNGVQMDDLTFALFCGLWNGLMDEIKGISDLVGMASGYYVDDKKNQEVQQLFAVLGGGNLWSMMKESLSNAHTGPTCKVAYQIGKDIMFVAVTLVPIAGAVTKAGRLGKLGTMTKVCTKLANALDVINPLTYVFKGMGLVIKKGVGATGSAVTIIGKKVGNDLDEVLRIRETTLLIQARYYIATQTSLINDLGPLEDLVLKARIIFSADNPSFNLATVASNGQETAINIGTDELILFAKQTGDGLDGLPPQRFVKKTVADKFIDALATRFLVEADVDFKIINLFGNQADEISQKIANLPSASKLLDNVDVRTALKELPDAKRKQFFEDIVEAYDVGDLPSDHIGKKIGNLTSDNIDSWIALLPDQTLRRSFDNVEKVTTYFATYPDRVDNFIADFASVTNKRNFLEKRGLTPHANWLSIGDIRTKLMLKYGHVLEVENFRTRNYQGETLQGFGGCHSKNALENHVANNSGSSYTIENKSFGTVNNGVYTGEPVITTADGSKYVKINNIPENQTAPPYSGESSFFPDTWDNNKILDEVEYAVKHNHGLEPGQSSTYFGYSSDGTVKIQFYYTAAQDKIPSYFPIKQ